MTHAVTKVSRSTITPAVQRGDIKAGDTGGGRRGRSRSRGAQWSSLTDTGPAGRNTQPGISACSSAAHGGSGPWARGVTRSARAHAVVGPRRFSATVAPDGPVVAAR